MDLRLRARAAALVTLAFAGTAGLCSAAVGPNGLIAYTACSYDTVVGRTTCDLWTVGPNGNDPAPSNVTNTPDVDEGDPTWSPDGSRLAFTRDLGACNTNLFVMEANGTRTRQVTYRDQPGTSACQLEPTWSPDGAELAFLRTNPSTFVLELVVIGVDTGVERVIVPEAGPNADFGALEIAWSPDGGKFAFSAVRGETMEDPVTGEPVSAAQYEIVTINADGTGEQIVSAGAPGSRRAVTLEEDRAPSWSPDGSFIVFMSQSQDPSCCQPWQLWVASRDGSTLTNISVDPGFDDTYPSWSPDGAKILFSRAVEGGTDLFTIPAPLAVAPAGAAALVEPVRVTTVGDASDPAWAPARVKGKVSRTLTVTLGGAGSGVVTSAPAGISCSGSDSCRARFPGGATVTLTAAASPGSVFLRWEGRACASKNGATCVVIMDGEKKARAVFGAAS